MASVTDEMIQNHRRKLEQLAQNQRSEEQRLQAAWEHVNERQRMLDEKKKQLNTQAETSTAEKCQKSQETDNLQRKIADLQHQLTEESNRHKERVKTADEYRTKTLEELRKRREAYTMQAKCMGKLNEQLASKDAENRQLTAEYDEKLARATDALWRYKVSVDVERKLRHQLELSTAKCHNMERGLHETRQRREKLKELLAREEMMCVLVAQSNHRYSLLLGEMQAGGQVAIERDFETKTSQEISGVENELQTLLQCHTQQAPTVTEQVDELVMKQEKLNQQKTLCRLRQQALTARFPQFRSRDDLIILMGYERVLCEILTQQQIETGNAHQLDVELSAREAELKKNMNHETILMGEIDAQLLETSRIQSSLCGEFPFDATQKPSQSFFSFFL